MFHSFEAGIADQFPTLNDENIFLVSKIDILWIEFRNAFRFVCQSH